MKKPPSTTTGIYKTTLAQLKKYAASKGWPLVYALAVIVSDATEAKK